MTDYKATVHLPQTDFPMKAELPKREPVQLEQWAAQDLYNALLAQRRGCTTFVLHDGPPYANASIHIGHMLNKILKDIVVKSKAMAGFYTPMIPGWDCHGLPIELAAEKELGGRDPARPRTVLRQACRAYAQKFVELQREQFQRLGVLADWEHPYRTMDFDYQANIAREFGTLVDAGAVYSGKRPIYWCASCRTALADTEVEYEDHTSPSIYVKFALHNIDDLRAQFNAPTGDISVVIWTTTPWTIPANLGVCVHPDYNYDVVQVGNEFLILATDLVKSAMEAMQVADYKTVATFPGKLLDRRVARHPLAELNRDSLLMLGDHVTLNAGTGCVHTAPGHGQDDFAVGMRYGLPAFAPIDDGGKYTNDVGLPDLVGLFIAKANPLVIDKLLAAGALVHQTQTKHQYPHCWRCHNPLLFRTTEQWFVSMEKTGVREKAIAAIEATQWIPAWGKNRILGMMTTRPDWCVSRQRSWGVPIIATRCGACNERGTTGDFVRHVAALFDTHGADYWYDTPVEELLPADYACPHCKKSGPFTKETDILDVWFDSGSSFAAVGEARLGLTQPIDLYLEGSDQHRGWFHTTLLVSQASRKHPPYRTVFTHGFVVDGQGRKYSKSAKNYIPPEQILAKYGAELLRLWVASEDYANDVRVSDEILGHIAESYRKIRNTCRYLLGSLSDFTAVDAVADTQLTSLDRWALHQCAQLVAECRAGYDALTFHTVAHAMNRFCTIDLSARYFDFCKDRLYCGAKTGLDRRAAQTVCWRILETLTRLIAPILSFTAEEVWRHLPGGAPTASVFFADLPTPNAAWQHADTGAQWDRFFVLRDIANRALETARNAKAIGGALDARLTIDCPDATREFLATLGLPLADLFLASQCQFGAVGGNFVARNDERGEPFAVSVIRIDSAKCERCWKRATDIGHSTAHPTLCGRCAQVLS